MKVEVNIEPCFGIDHNLSLICQPTSEDMKLYVPNMSTDIRGHEALLHHHEA